MSSENMENADGSVVENEMNIADEDLCDLTAIETEHEDGNTFVEGSTLTLFVNDEQESALDTFFQINNWQLIKVSREEDAGDGNHLLTVQITSDQEAAIEALFQINNWTLIKQVSRCEVDDIEGGMQADENMHLEEQHVTQVEEVDSIVEEMGVSSSGLRCQPQVITLYSKPRGKALSGIPSSVMDLNDEEGSSHVIIQEITLPEGMTLDQGLVFTNPTADMTRKVTPRGTIKPGDKIHKCHVCGKTFKQAQSFNGHYQTHFGAKPYKCDICNAGFTLKAALVAHHSIHTGIKPYSCALCDKGFRRKDDMMSHLRTHTGEKPYECDICGKKFKYRNQIPKHKRGHTGEKPYECETCKKRFTSNIHLTRHIRTHTGERPYKCTVCDKAFTQFGHLQAHTRIHNDERPFECTVCGRRFREKKVMRRHEALHTAERKFICAVCGRGFLRQSNLDLHSVMHQTGPKLDGLKRGRPRPKKKLEDAEMRDFVASVLINVSNKVDTGAQTDSLMQHTGPGAKTGPAHSGSADGLAALVNLAVEQRDSQGATLSDLADLQAISNGNQQMVLVMNEDGTGSYIISNYQDNEEMSALMPSQQVEVSTAVHGVAGRTENYDNDAEMAMKTLEKVVYQHNLDSSDQNMH